MRVDSPADAEDTPKNEIYLMDENHQLTMAKTGCFIEYKILKLKQGLSSICKYSKTTIYLDSFK